MNWIKYSINTTTDAEDFVSAALIEIGIDSIEIEDNVPIEDGDRQGGVFAELQPDMLPDDGKSVVSFYLEEDAPQEEKLAEVRAALDELRETFDIGEGTIVTSVTKQEDWINNWKAFFSSFSIGNILIKPTWEELEEKDNDKILIEIDPGVSFGTGKHESTQLCITQLQKYLKKDDNVLDVGCGSGILSIVALKLGAKHTTGTDIDPDCMGSVAENFEVNNLPSELGSFYTGNLIDDKDLQDTIGYEKYDFVCANILADIIIAMASQIEATMKHGALLVTSGIINFKEEEVATALKNVGLEIVEANHLGEWVNITARKN